METIGNKFEKNKLYLIVLTNLQSTKMVIQCIKLCIKVMIYYNNITKQVEIVDEYKSKIKVRSESMAWLCKLVNSLAR